MIKHYHCANFRYFTYRMSRANTCKHLIITHQLLYVTLTKHSLNFVTDSQFAAAPSKIIIYPTTTHSSQIFCASFFSYPNSLTKNSFLTIVNVAHKSKHHNSPSPPLTVTQLLTTNHLTHPPRLLFTHYNRPRHAQLFIHLPYDYLPLHPRLYSSSFRTITHPPLAPLLNDLLHHYSSTFLNIIRPPPALLFTHLPQD